MKKIFILAVLAALSVPAMAQVKDNVFDVSHVWNKYFGYSYQPAYPYGLSLSGGSFLSVGFADANAAPLEVSANKKYCKPTWSMRFGWIGYHFDKDVTGMGAITFRPYMAMGMNFAKDSISSDNGLTYNEKKNTYFTMAPSIVVNIYMVHFSVGYEIVPACKQMNGLNFGVGISFPSSSDDNASKKAKSTSKQVYSSIRGKKK